ncbi:hypothetical protein CAUPRSCDRAFT_11537 [Caulochytrium protostelioides]|uniref:Mannosyltransferase n=1 Tax=Caulochytrium protostelioides TaxID=1555241 RepID=A0A4P9WTY3_9FUNG|nr:hypothetical protein CAUPRSCDRAFT_11537 [Caulochytrium protostelioides]
MSNIRVARARRYVDLEPLLALVRRALDSTLHAATRSPLAADAGLGRAVGRAVGRAGPDAAPPAVDHARRVAAVGAGGRGPWPAPPHGARAAPPRLPRRARCGRRAHLLQPRRVLPGARARVRPRLRAPRRVPHLGVAPAAARLAAPGPAGRRLPRRRGRRAGVDARRAAARARRPARRPGPRHPAPRPPARRPPRRGLDAPRAPLLVVHGVLRRPRLQQHARERRDHRRARVLAVPGNRRARPPRALGRRRAPRAGRRGRRRRRRRPARRRRPLGPARPRPPLPRRRRRARAAADGLSVRRLVRLGLGVALPILAAAIALDTKIYTGVWPGMRVAGTMAAAPPTTWGWDWPWPWPHRQPPELTALTFLRANVGPDGVATFYGTHPWHWYLSQGLPALALGWIVPFLYALRCPRPPSRRPADAAADGDDDAVPLNPFPVRVICVIVATYSLLAHKEFRFLAPALPLVLILAGCGLRGLWTWRRRLAGPSAAGMTVAQRRTARLQQRAIVLLIATMVLLDVGALGFFGRWHQRGVVAVVDFLRAETAHPQGLTSARSGDGDDAGGRGGLLFLMPCHSTPFLADLDRPGVPMRFLRCEPPLAPAMQQRRIRNGAPVLLRGHADPIAASRRPRLDWPDVACPAAAGSRWAAPDGLRRAAFVGGAGVALSRLGRRVRRRIGTGGGGTGGGIGGGGGGGVSGGGIHPYARAADAGRGRSDARAHVARPPDRGAAPAPSTPPRTRRPGKAHGAGRGRSTAPPLVPHRRL